MKQKKWIWLTSALLAAGIAVSLTFPSFAMENSPGKAPPDKPPAPTTDHPAGGRDLDTFIKKSGWIPCSCKKKALKPGKGP